MDKIKNMKLTKTIFAGVISGAIVALTTLIFLQKENTDQCKHVYDNNLELNEALLERKEYIILLEEEVKRLSDENGIFTSMLGEIESQPGGSEILKELWDRHHNHEIE